MKNQISRLVFVFSLVLFMGCNKDDSMVQETPNIFTQEESGSTLKKASFSAKYIVVLNSDANISNSDLAVKKEKMKSRITGLLKKNAITINPEETYQSALQGFSIKMTPGQAKKLAGDGDVKIIEADQVISLGIKNGKGKPFAKTVVSAPVSNEIIPWGVSRVGGGIDASGKTAWIIDTGIDLSHPDLNVDVIRSRSFLVANSSPIDENGHGTHVAGTIAAVKGNGIGVVGVAAGATVVAVRVLNINGYGTTAEVIAGVDYVAANGKSGDVANMSLGDGDSPALDAAVLSASSTGIFFVLAAGNYSTSATAMSPARINGPYIYTVSAMDKYDIFATFSNYGNSPIDFCAPGVEIYSTYRTGYYATLEGTSMAAPHVAGLLLIGAINTDGFVLGDPDGVPDPIAHH